uniref:Uncharacterized protein n=1 Tax=Cuerna arida TaxID=1464854 RepID=A0A1B6FX12_9HEMI
MERRLKLRPVVSAVLHLSSGKRGAEISDIGRYLRQYYGVQNASEYMPLLNKAIVEGFLTKNKNCFSLSTSKDLLKISTQSALKARKRKISRTGPGRKKRNFSGDILMMRCLRQSSLERGPNRRGRRLLRVPGLKGGSLKIVGARKGQKRNRRQIKAGFAINAISSTHLAEDNITEVHRKCFTP